MTVFVLSVGVFTGCGKSDDKSASSGKLVIACGAQEDWCQAQTQAFQEATGVETSFVRLASGEAVTRLETEKDAPSFDVWHGGPADGYQAAADKGLLEKYVSPESNVVDAKYKDSDGYWTGIYLGALGFCSNKDILSEIGASKPTSWKSLLDTKFKQNISVAHPLTSGTSYAALWTQYVLNNDSEDKALNYFKELKPNILQFTKSGSAPGQMAGKGEIATAIIFSHDCVKFQDEGMTNLEVSFPSEGTGYEIGGVGIIKNTQNLTDAQKYVDWSLGVDSQKIGETVGSYQIPLNPDTPVTDKMVKLDDVKLIDYDTKKAASLKDEFTARFDKEVTTAPTE